MASVPAATKIVAPGVDITSPATAAAATQTIANDGKTHVVIKNGNAGAIVLTEVVQQKYTADGGAPIAVPNRTVTIAAGHVYYAGPWDPNTYNDSNNEVTLQLDVFSTVTLQAYRH